MDSLFAKEQQPASGPACGRDMKKAAEANALKLLPKIIEASLWGQQDTAEKIGRDIAHIIEPTHPAVAQNILKQFAASTRPAKLVRRPEQLVDFCDARHGLNDVILPEAIERECRAIVMEHQRSNELAQFGLTPRPKILLCGPPGNGKTRLQGRGLRRRLVCAPLPSGCCDSPATRSQAATPGGDRASQVPA
jgi:SpoVK/Ycf46/Vps4 family AAA+-type ATPase